MSRLARLHEIESLDPERDHRRIYHLFVGWEFPWDVTRALELALYRTFCVPSIAELLDRTGEFRERPQRRYDDTALLIATICEHGYDAGPGAEAVARMNAIHAQFRISNDDYRYVLSTFVLEPVRWIDAYGWRRTSRHERIAAHAFWRELGGRMGITDIPPTYDALEAWSIGYERAHFRYSEATARVGQATRELFCSWFPSRLRPLVRRGVHALLDEAMLSAFGFPHPTDLERAAVRAALRSRGDLAHALPARATSAFLTGRPSRSHPDGFRVENAGPPGFLKKVQRSR
jgi:hypothetical protein